MTVEILVKLATGIGEGQTVISTHLRGTFPVYNRVGLSRLSLTQASKVELEWLEDLETVRVCSLMEALKKRRSRLSLRYCIEEPTVLRGILGYCIEFCIWGSGVCLGP